MSEKIDWCYYVPGNKSIVDTIAPDGLTTYGRQTTAQVMERCPAAEIHTLEEAAAAIDALARTPIHEIDEERFEYFLECLPPVGYSSQGGVTAFRMMERKCGPITGIYASAGGRYFEMDDDITLPHSEIVRRVREFMG